MNDKTKIDRLKANAVDFLNLVVAGKIDEAYAKYVDMGGKHHNVYFQAGFPSLKRAMIDSHNQFPAKNFEIKNVLGDDDMVAVHSKIELKAGEPGMTVVHLFRFKGDKIVEMWDIGQEIPFDLPNTDGPI